MPKIAIVSTGYAWFPCEPGPSRFFDIAWQFVRAGYEVEIITVDFQHFQKQPRDKENIFARKYPFTVTFIKTPAYKKNIDPRRMCSNVAVARRVSRYLKEHHDYDVVYCSIPSNAVAEKTAKACRAFGIPFIIDVEDLWPEAMKMALGDGFLQRLAFSPIERKADRAYQLASGVVGTSEDYTDRAFQKRNRDIPAETVYVGCNLSEFDTGVHEYKSAINKPEGEFWVTYAGSISNSYDIRTLIDAVQTLGPVVQLQLLGTGSLKEELEAYSQHMDNVHFWGFTQYPKMAAVLAHSDVVVNSFVKGAPQSIVNKVGDYLASGKPMINTLENPVFQRLVTRYGFGINVEPENVAALAQAIQTLQQDPAIRQDMGQKARTLCEQRFDRAHSYQRIVQMADAVVKPKGDAHE